MLWVFSMASRLDMLVCDVLTFHVMHVGCSGLLDFVGSINSIFKFFCLKFWNNNVC